MRLRIDPDELVDAHAVARLIGVSQRNTVSLYQRRYSDMPRPVIDLGRGRCKLWIRAEVLAWAKKTGREGT